MIQVCSIFYGARVFIISTRPDEILQESEASRVNPSIQYCFRHELLYKSDLRSCHLQDPLRTGRFTPNPTPYTGTSPMTKSAPRGPTVVLGGAALFYERGTLVSKSNPKTRYCKP